MCNCVELYGSMCNLDKFFKIISKQCPAHFLYFSRTSSSEIFRKYERDFYQSCGKGDILILIEYLVLYVKEPVLEVEDKIALYAKTSYLYAHNILKGRFEKGEYSISQDPLYSFQYALTVLKGRFLLGEKAIIEHENIVLEYTKHVLNGNHFPLYEEKIFNEIDYQKILNYFKIIEDGYLLEGLFFDKLSEILDLEIFIYHSLYHCLMKIRHKRSLLIERKLDESLGNLYFDYLHPDKSLICSLYYNDHPFSMNFSSCFYKMRIPSVENILYNELLVNYVKRTGHDLPHRRGLISHQTVEQMYHKHLNLTPKRYFRS